MIRCFHPQDGSTDIAGKIGEVCGKNVALLIGPLQFL
jgi:hypothetical protein